MVLVHGERIVEEKKIYAHESSGQGDEKHLPDRQKG